MEEQSERSKDFRFTALAFVALFIMAGFLGFRFATAQSITTDKFPVTGSLWSDNIGWTLFGEYAGGAEFNTDAEGYLHGWGWSDNLGWLKFDRSLTGVRGGGNNYGARFDPATMTLTGWARYCAGTINGDCLSAGRTDGWDGWLKFTDVPLTTSTQNGDVITTAEGWAWGAEVVGWTKVLLSLSGDIEPEGSCDPETDPDACEDDGSGNQAVGCYLTTATTEIPPLSEYGFSWAATGYPDVCESEDFDITEGELSGLWQEDWPATGEQAEKTYRLTCHDGSKSGNCSITFTEATETESNGLTADLYFNTLTSERQVTATYGERQGNVNPIGPFNVRLGSVLNFVWESNGAERCDITSDAFTTTNQLPNGVIEYSVTEDIDINVHLECINTELQLTAEDDLIIQVTDPVFREF